MVQTLIRGIRQVRCSGCRLSLLCAFAAIAGKPIQRTWQQSRARHSLGYQMRTFSAGPQDVVAPRKHHEEQLITGKDGGESSDPHTLHPAHIPWYMRVERLSKPPQLLPESQRLPELPGASPNILQPLLEQLSVELGLDSLSLLDLRGLDPPPALGANLLMIIGTARSEKHLHVSADRFCRWLRSEYKLHPDADGLLGRYELKLKLKRKNRRVKLLGDRAAEDNLDDGVRTGWVCINIGTVESSTDISKGTTERDDFVGFGRQTDGVKIVVQMLVEEKRQELDLESLWGGIAMRRSTPESDSKFEIQSQATATDAVSPVANDPGNSVSNPTKYCLLN